ncbi:hypothetical protein CDAR_95381 [Caerostris darwini]|uniref:Uncharacterized protein n=1 Tax=Caerostris darwini TaxID=1538125 RepID=A0AAV4PIC6_9ARAC|nr:hypothetical protein CDAR_95381 [Caerostris darwini]
MITDNFKGIKCTELKKMSAIISEYSLQGLYSNPCENLIGNDNLKRDLVDVHVYVVPSDEWIEQRKLAKRDIIDQAVSSGFVRYDCSNEILKKSPNILCDDIASTMSFIQYT